MRARFEAIGRAAALGIISVKIVFWVDSVSESEKSCCVRFVSNNPQKKRKSMVASSIRVDSDAVIGSF